MELKGLTKLVVIKSPLCKNMLWRCKTIYRKWSRHYTYLSTNLNSIDERTIAFTVLGVFRSNCKASEKYCLYICYGKINLSSVLGWQVFTLKQNWRRWFCILYYKAKKIHLGYGDNNFLTVPLKTAFWYILNQ